MSDESDEICGHDFRYYADIDSEKNGILIKKLCLDCYLDDEIFIDSFDFERSDYLEIIYNYHNKKELNND